jgi:hypothetical protein
VCGGVGGAAESAARALRFLASAMRSSSLFRFSTTLRSARMVLNSSYVVLERLISRGGEDTVAKVCKREMKFACMYFKLSGAASAIPGKQDAKLS